MNRPSPWLFENPTATQSEYETALTTEWEMRPPSRAMSRPASRPAGRPSRAPSRSTSRPVSRSPRRPLIRPRQTHPRQQTIVVPRYLNQPNSTSSVSASSDTGANRILIATIDQFEFGSYLLTKHQFEQLHDFIIILNDNKESLANVQFSFIGHTDDTGGDSKGNRSLSFRRAVEIENFVRGFFSKEHPSLATRSRGRSSKESIAPNTTKDGQARNRRVEVFSDVPLQPAK
jgi:outer membrane protein OmpA-like peptidoglycan-associated protein